MRKSFCWLFWSTISPEIDDKRNGNRQKAKEEAPAFFNDHFSYTLKSRRKKRAKTTYIKAKIDLALYICQRGTLIY